MKATMEKIETVLTGIALIGCGLIATFWIFKALHGALLSCAASTPWTPLI